ncbi:MAG: histidine phosphatase family protein [Flavobacteriaceae bacterium]|nr:histidine phosphatase family protein [Flavobacteriaceae bacterium]
MKKLIIVRHAKSSWDLPIDDHDRALMEKGILRARNHAKILKNQLDFEPEFWISSSAVRALSTAVIFAEEMNRIQELKIDNNLYTFSASSLISEILHFPDSHESAILFGHNDACLETIRQLSNDSIPYFKTAEIALIEFEQNSWKSISNGRLRFRISQGNLIV